VLRNAVVEHLVPPLALEGSLAMAGPGQLCRQPLPVAVKQVRKVSSEEDRDRLAAEILCLAQFRGHRHIAQLVGAVTLVEHLAMVVEYCSRGSLEVFLKAAKRQSFSISWPFRSRILAQIALGVKAISDFGLVHKDLAARNILLTRQLTPKIADMELCCFESLPGDEMIPPRWIGEWATCAISYMCTL
jgi:serine/threonine protein kinase